MIQGKELKRKQTLIKQTAPPWQSRARSGNYKPLGISMYPGQEFLPCLLMKATRDNKPATGCICDLLSMKTDIHFKPLANCPSIDPALLHSSAPRRPWLSVLVSRGRFQSRLLIPDEPPGTHSSGIPRPNMLWLLYIYKKCHRALPHINSQHHTMYKSNGWFSKLKIKPSLYITKTTDLSSLFIEKDNHSENKPLLF